MPSIPCLHTLYNNKNINTKACYINVQSKICTYPILKHIYLKKSRFQQGQFYMCTYRPQQQKHKQKGFSKNSRFYMCTYPLEQHKRPHKGLFLENLFLHV